MFKRLQKTLSTLDFWLWFLLATALSAYLGYITGWKVYEYDIFWHSRAGEEILKNGMVQTVETWSHTVNGEPWYHFQWLSSVVTYLFAKVLFKPWDGMIWLRMGLTTLLFFLIARIVRITTKPLKVNWLNLWTLLLLLGPWIYLMVWARLQMRPDLFGVLFFVGLLCLLVSSVSELKKRWIGLSILLLWSNFHSGTVPMGIMLWSVYFFAEKYEYSWSFVKKQSPWFLLAFLIWFAQPQGWNILNITGSWYGISVNPDLTPIMSYHFTYKGGGYTYFLWTAMSLFSLFTLWKLKKEKRYHELPPGFRKPFFAWSVFIFLAYMTLDKKRMIPYHVFFMVPIVTWGLSRASRYFFKRAIVATPVIVGFLLIFFWGIALPDQVKNLSVERGWGLADGWHPVNSVNFIKQMRPKRELLNFYNFGAYITDQLRSYPVFIDGREIPFLEFEQKMNKAKRKPDTYAKFLKELNINVALEPRPQNARMKRMYEIFYPRKEWAHVFSDAVSVVYFRRIPEHKTQLDLLERGITPKKKQ